MPSSNQLTGFTKNVVLKFVLFEPRKKKLCRIHNDTFRLNVSVLVFIKLDFNDKAEA